jgi:hypothetical protein
MALTFAAEMILLMYVLVKRGVRTVEHRLIVTVLFFLAIFQLSEYGVCEAVGFDETIWARLGFAAITMLPPLGLHLIQRIRKDKNLVFTQIGYIMALLFISAFTFFDSFESISCEGNYAIFEVMPGLGGAYFAYYYSLLLTGAVLAFLGWKERRGKSEGTILLLIIAGYGSFVLPATFIHFVFEQAGNGLPSIMCGFALIFAIMLGTLISNRLPIGED